MKLTNVADTFSRAMEKLSMAENTSDISTDSDPNVIKLKRRRHARKILSDDEEESYKKIKILFDMQMFML